MKKWISLLLCLTILSITGCGSSQPADTSKNQPENVNKTAAASKTSNETAASDNKDVDVDLTTLSSTMVYSEVYNMTAKPEDYIGKTVKMAGLYTCSSDETTNKNYFACIIQDATACCAQGIEFILTDDYAYPKDYPDEGEEICVIGVFDTYKEGEYTFCTLKDAKLI